MSYSRGVLIHNFNEDQYGIDLQRIPKPIDPPKVSVSHTVHHWKCPEEDEKPDPAAAHCVPQHILFGHTGDMRDPHTNLQKREFASSSHYFYQDPAKVIGGVGTLTADGFTISDDPLRVVKDPSNIASKIRDGWGDRRQAHSLPANDRFMTETRRQFSNGVNPPGWSKGKPRAYGEFSRSKDATNLTRSSASLRGGVLGSTGKLLAQ